MTKKGTFVVNPATGVASLKGVFAGGDCVNGADLASTAGRTGVVAAAGILRYFLGEPWEELSGQCEVSSAEVR